MSQIFKSVHRTLYVQCTICTVFTCCLLKSMSPKKNLEIKTLVKKPQFSEVLGQNVTGNLVLSFRFLGLFFKYYRSFSVYFFLFFTERLFSISLNDISRSSIISIFFHHLSQKFRPMSISKYIVY